MSDENSYLNHLLSDDSEFVHFYPKGYRAGAHKYIFVTGGVMSGVGKGIFCSSLAYLLKCYGYSVTIVKTEGYLNIDSGTLNPFRHGEVFVLEDGTETDLDLGNYERFLDENLDGGSFITSGKVYNKVLTKEREGKYLGRDVLVIPHLTGEVKYLWREKALQHYYDIIIVEIGGTVGDYENLHYIESARQMRREEGHDQVIFCQVSPIIYLEGSGELKSKPTQHGVKSLMQCGIQPDFVICRSPKHIPHRVKEKVSLYCNVPLSHVIEAPNCDSIYHLPKFLNKEGHLIESVRKRLKLAPVQGHTPNFPLDEYEKKSRELKDKPFTVMVAGKYVSNTDSYLSILQALEHSGVKEEMNIDVQFFDVGKLEDVEDMDTIRKFLESADGIIVPGGFGSRGVEEKIKVIHYARVNAIPFLGICMGFQVALIEIARNVCMLQDGNSTEFNNNTKHPIICLLPEQLEVNQIGGTMRLGLQKVLINPHTKTYDLYQENSTQERFRHRYEFNPEYQSILEDGGILFSGKSQHGNIFKIFELKNHPYFIGSQFHPEYLSKPLKARPLFFGLLQAIKKQSLVGKPHKNPN